MYVSPLPVPESAIFGYRRVPRHVLQYPWHRMRVLAIASAISASLFHGKKNFRAVVEVAVVIVVRGDRCKVALFHAIEKCYFMRFVFTYIHHLCD